MVNTELRNVFLEVIVQLGLLKSHLTLVILAIVIKIINYNVLVTISSFNLLSLTIVVQLLLLILKFLCWRLISILLFILKKPLPELILILFIKFFGSIFLVIIYPFKISLCQCRLSCIASKSMNVSALTLKGSSIHAVYSSDFRLEGGIEVVIANTVELCIWKLRAWYLGLAFSSIYSLDVNWFATHAL
jgi:hypothetical protein